MAVLSLFSAPAVEPVTLSEAKLFAKIDVTDDDALVTDLIAGARKALEDRWNWSFITQTWDLFLDAFPVDDWWYPLPIVFPRAPLQSVTTVKYTTDQDSLLTVASADYQVDAISIPGRVLPKINKAWPADLLRAANGVEVRFVSGYGVAAANVPEQVRQTIKQLVAFWYEHRDETGNLPDWVDDALESVRGGFAYA